MEDQDNNHHRREETSDEEWERYGTINRWSSELGIDRSAIAKRLKGVVGVTGRTYNGRVIDNGFYPESVVEEKCVDLLETEHQANGEGFLTIGRARYGTSKAWSRVFPISDSTFKRRLKDKEYVVAKDQIGRTTRFYSERVVREACLDLLGGKLQTDRMGFVFKEDVDEKKTRFGHVNAWKNELSLGYSVIKKRLQKAEYIEGRDQEGRFVKLYSEEVVRTACAAVLRSDIPAADVEGIIRGNPRFGTAHAWAQKYSLAPETVRLRLKKKQGITGRIQRGRIIKDGFYSEEDFLEVCADLLQEAPVADGEGFFVFQSETYGTVEAWSRKLPIANVTIRSRLKDVHGIDGKLHNSRQVIVGGFYSESDVRRVCIDLLQRKN